MGVLYLLWAAALAAVAAGHARQRAPMRMSVTRAKARHLTRSHMLRAAIATTLCPRPAAARDCFVVTAGARATIRETLENYERSQDPSNLRPVAKDLMRQGGPLRECLDSASRLEALPEATRFHARDAMEYIASVVEFDAFDKLTKEYEPKASQMYTPQKLSYSLRAFEAADRELNLFAFGLRQAVGAGNGYYR
jgi:hypothetical protein